MLALLSFLQFLYLSAILTVFFCGIVMSHYTWHNVTESSRVTTKYVQYPLSVTLNTWISFPPFLAEKPANSEWQRVFSLQSRFESGFFGQPYSQHCRAIDISLLTNCLLQACFCHSIICCWDFHLPLCWYGCFGHWEMESC